MPRRCPWPLHWLLIALMVLTLLLLWCGKAEADPGTVPLFWYGGESDGKLGAPTAFADSWTRPWWLWPTVRDDRLGIALVGYEPGTWVRVTVVGLPGWASSWPELWEVIGNSTIAVVADRPGAEWYADGWKFTFSRLAPLWVGVLDVEIEEVLRWWRKGGRYDAY